MIIIKAIFKKFLYLLGYDIAKFVPRHHSLARRKMLIQSYAIDCILDVGASVGDYAKEMRSIGYDGEIISFEPIHDVFLKLQKNSGKDSRWYTKNYALGDSIGEERINISANSDSSSLLEMLPAHAKAASESIYVSSELISVKTLDSIFSEICQNAKSVYLKIDAQGFEKNILIGAENSLARIDTIQLELSLIPLYDGAPDYLEMINILIDKGYELVSMEDGFADNNTGRLLQFDAIFHRYA